MKSFLRRTLPGAWLAAALLLPACTSPTQAPPPAAEAAPQLTAAQLRQDLDQLYDTLQAAHYDLYARRDRASYDALHARLRARLDQPMTVGDAQLELQRFVAFGRVAHARIDLPFERWAAFREGGGKAIALSLRVRDDAVYVLSDPADAEGVAPGDRVLTIDEQPALDWLARVGGLVSADNPYLLHAQMEGMLPFLAWLTLGEVDGVQLELSDGDGAPHRVWLPATTRADIAAAEAAGRVPATLDLSGRDARMLDDRVAYLRPGPFYDIRPEADSPWDRSHFRAWLDQAFADFIAAGATDLLLDLRDNPGGDNSFSDLVLAWFADEPFRFSPAFEIRVSAATIASNQARLDALPEDAGGASADMAALFKGQPMGSVVRYDIPLASPRTGTRFEGRVHVLVNRHSYSNAVSVAAIVQDYGFGRVLGEETADLASTLGAMEHFTLAHSGLRVGYPKARMLRPSGDATPRGVVPDVTLSVPVVEGPDDPVLQAALASIRR
ncbi:S41 family peptidase [Arenimonas aestuarii]